MAAKKDWTLYIAIALFIGVIYLVTNSTSISDVPATTT